MAHECIFTSIARERVVEILFFFQFIPKYEHILDSTSRRLMRSREAQPPYSIFPYLPQFPHTRLEYFFFSLYRPKNDACERISTQAFSGGEHKLAENEQMNTYVCFRKIGNVGRR
jgi:hypothetical protein